MPMNQRLLRPLAAAGFDPKKLSGLVGWWDASKTSTLAQNSDGSTAAASGDPIAYWGDLSGNGNDMTQPTNGLRPSLSGSGINGRPSISVPNVSNAGFSSINRPTTATSATAFLVANLASVGNANSLSFRDSTGGRFFDAAASNNLSPATSSGSPSYRVNGVAIQALRSAMSTALVRGPQFLQNVSSINFSAWTDTWQAFNFGSSFQWVGLVGECLIYDRALTVSERDAVETYLKRKWGTP